MYDLKELLGTRTIIACFSETQAQDLLKELSKLGGVWQDGNTEWDSNEEIAYYQLSNFPYINSITMENLVDSDEGELKFVEFAELLINKDRIIRKENLKEGMIVTLNISHNALFIGDVFKQRLNSDHFLEGVWTFDDNLVSKRRGVNLYVTGIYKITHGGYNLQALIDTLPDPWVMPIEEVK